MRRPPSPYRRAFTLVELSIVLVILGLLVGGVLAGQSLIRAAELRAITREKDSYDAALSIFRDKYFALPGDMLNASDYWGLMHLTQCTSSNTLSSYTATCNGNGDGYLGVVATHWREPLRVFQHLARAGLVEGSYNGITPPGASPTFGPMQVGPNSPASKISGASWGLYGLGLTDETDTFHSRANNFWFFGKPVPGFLSQGPILKPEEAYNIDVKLDDGKPHTGTVTTFRRGRHGQTNCITSSEDAYALSEPAVMCSLVFATAY